MIAIRVFHPDAHRPELHKARSFPFTIGRAVDNDLVLDYPFISAHHAEIIPSDKGCLLNDLDSRNGITVNDKRVDSVEIADANQELYLGSLRLEITCGSPLTSVTAVHHPDAYGLRPGKPLGFWKGLALNIAGVLLIFLAAGINYLETSYIDQPEDLLSMVVAIVLFVFFVGLPLSIFSKINSGKYSYFRLTPFIFLGVFLLDMLAELNAVLSFNMNNAWAESIIRIVLLYLVYSYTCFPMARIIFSRLARRKIKYRMRGAFAILLAIGFLNYYIMTLQSSHYRFSSDISYTIVPLSLRAEPVSSLKEKLQKSTERIGEYRIERLEELGESPKQNP